MANSLEKFTLRVLTLPRQVKWILAVGLDSALCALAVWIAFYLRLGEWNALYGLQWWAVAISILLAIPVFFIAGVYRTVFRYSGTSSIVIIAQAMLVYGVAYAAIFTLGQIDTIPRTLGIIQPGLLFMLLASSRVLLSWWLGGSIRDGGSEEDRGRVLIYGAGSAGRQLCLALQESKMQVIAFVDDDAKLQGRTMMGKPILQPERIERLASRHRLSHIMLAIPSASRHRRNEILELVRPLKVKVQTLPAMTDVALGKVRINELRDPDIDDLLGREVVEPEHELMRSKIADKVVLVTGAGGSIGSELCRQILSVGPRSLIMVDSSEAALFAIQHELELVAAGQVSPVEIVPLLGSVTNRERMSSIVGAYKPATVYHAAAYKHVPLVEHNPLEGIYNNVFGTKTTASVCMEADVADFVLISTDKAVRPTNVMGASKRLAEMVLQALARKSDRTRFSMVRFGNVLGSSGSVVPLFRKQIAAGGPITITHPDITRYFMTIPEAAQLVIQAGAMGEGGEVFVLDMGEPVRIVDLARRMVELSGLKFGEPGSEKSDIEYAITGLRPGEKLYEELLIGRDPRPTRHPRVAMASEPFLDWEKLTAPLETLQRHIAANEVMAARHLLRDLVPEYTPERDIVDFVYLRQGSAAA